MLRQYVDLSCQNDDPDAGARELLGGRPAPKLPKPRPRGGTSPLHLASCRGHVGVVHELLLAGADATRGDQFGFSALHLAARHGFPDVIKELLTHGSISVDLLDESGETALHTAARYAKTVCMSRLLDLGGDAAIVSKSGRLAIDVVGQGQDKHNLLTLPHAATQITGCRRSAKHATNMPPAQLPRDKCTEERARRLLVAAAEGRKVSWAWPASAATTVRAAIFNAANDAAHIKGSKDGDASSSASPTAATGTELTGDGEGVTRGVGRDKPRAGLASNSSADNSNTRAVVGGAMNSETFNRAMNSNSLSGTIPGAAGGSTATATASRGQALGRLNVRRLAKGRKGGDTRVLKAINRCGGVQQYLPVN